MKRNTTILCFLITLLFSTGHSQSKNIQFKKCCQIGQIFDEISLSCSQITDEKVFENLNLLSEKLFYLDSFEDDKTSHDISLQDFSIGMADCEKSKLNVLEIGQDYKVTNEGKLLSVNSGSYESSLDLGDFCLDILRKEDGRINTIAVICDPCQTDARFCVRACCPPSELHKCGKCVKGKLGRFPETGF